MNPRTADDVWRQVQHIARLHVQSGEPILTLTNGVSNWITAVDEDRIHRRSSRPRASHNPQNQISRNQVAAIWDQIIATGSSLDARAERREMILAFAYALVAQIPGVGHRGTYDLYFASPELAMRSFGS